MSEERPVKLRFFDEGMTHRFSGLCTKLGIGFTVLKEEDLPDEVTTTPMKSTERRKLIAAWSDASIERI